HVVAAERARIGAEQRDQHLVERDALLLHAAGDLRERVAGADLDFVFGGAAARGVGRGGRRRGAARGGRSRFLTVGLRLGGGGLLLGAALALRRARGLALLGLGHRGRLRQRRRRRRRGRHDRRRRRARLLCTRADRRGRIEEQRVFADETAGGPRDLEDDVDEGFLDAAIADEAHEQAAVG